MLEILFERLEFAFESLSKAQNLHSNGSNPFRKARICIRMPRIPFEWLEFGFERFESLSNGSNLHSNRSNPFRRVQICIRKLRIHFEFAIERFESHSNVSNLHSNPVRMVRIFFRMLRIPFQWFKFVCFERDSNASNPFRKVRISI